MDSFPFVDFTAMHDLILFFLLLLLIRYRVGSMLALDRPFISSSVDTTMETCGEICLEYGSATQLYLVPFVQHEEQVRDGGLILGIINFKEELTSVFLRYL